MTIFCDKDMCIRDVGVNSKQDPNLTAYEVSDDSFQGWSYVKICCYKVSISDGVITSLTPYVDTKLIEQLERFGTYKETKPAYIGSTEVTFDKRPGCISAYVMCEGVSVPCTIESTDKIYVKFEPLTNQGTVSITIQ